MQKYFIPSLLFFVLAGVFGSILRLAFIWELPFSEYRHFLQAHSHTAMLGWIYLALTVALHKVFLPADAPDKFYHRLSLLAILAVFGMSISFVLWGYAPFSIAFTTGHLLISYAFCWRFWGDLKKFGLSGFSTLLAKTAMIFMVLSTLGVWLLGPVMFLMRHSALYYALVQFFLHFQFNGWFLFGVAALFFRLLEQIGIQGHPRYLRYFYYLLVGGTLLTFALAVAWSTPKWWIYLLNSVGATLQLAAFVFLILGLKNIVPRLKPHLDYRYFILFRVSLVVIVLKGIIQSVVVLPFMAKIAYTIRNYVMGFIHLLMLAGISLFLIGYGYHHHFIRLHSTWSPKGMFFLLSGIILTELILFVQGTMLWIGWGFLPCYYYLIFLASLCIPIGVAVLIVAHFRKD